jgi:hypothetical protein
VTVSRRTVNFGLGSLALAGSSSAAWAQKAIDNSAVMPPAAFRKHVATYGLVYRLPKEVNDVLDAKIKGPLKEKLIAAKLVPETKVSNIPHVTVVHIHSADKSTPGKMLKAMPKLPPVLNHTLKTFYTTEAAKGAGQPWWFDLGIVKSGDGFENMMTFNTRATAVYAVMSDAAKELVRATGVSGVNVMKDGKEVRSHNPHNTMVYSMAKFDSAVQKTFNDFAEECNKILPDGINSSFKDVSIVEIGFAGNVLREFYRISLENGAVTDVATGKKMPPITG